MNLSSSQWLSSIVFDLLIKILLVTGIGLAVTFGFVSIAMLVAAAVALSLLHFLCLFLGATLVLALELFRVRLSPMLRFMASVAVANILFVGLLVVLLAPGPNDVPATASDSFVSSLILAASNLIAIFAGATVGRLIGPPKPEMHADNASPGS